MPQLTSLVFNNTAKAICTSGSIPWTPTSDALVAISIKQLTSVSLFSRMLTKPSDGSEMRWYLAVMILYGSLLTTHCCRVSRASCRLLSLVCEVASDNQAGRRVGSSSRARFKARIAFPSRSFSCCRTPSSNQAWASSG